MVFIVPGLFPREGATQKIAKKRRANMRRATLKAVIRWWHTATHPSDALMAFHIDFPEDVDPDDQNVFSLFREIGLGVVWKSLSAYRRQFHRSLMPLKPRGRFHEPDFFEDLPDGIFVNTSSGIDMERLCSNFDEECGGMQEIESSLVLGNEVTAPARAATTNAAGGFDFGNPNPTTATLSL